MLQLLILFFVVLIGGAIGLRASVVNKKYLKSALIFSASFILGITVLHLMPMVFGNFQFEIGLWVLAGFFLQILLETLSSGVEHGHIHAKANAPRSWATQILLGLCLHSFIEGMPLLDLAESNLIHNHEHASGEWNYFLSLIFHKIPAAYALVLLLKHSGFKTRFVWIALLIFAAMSPIGALIVDFIQLSEISFQRLMAFVIGAFLHISTTIMFETETSDHHHLSLSKIAFSLLGIAMAIAAELL